MSSNPVRQIEKVIATLSPEQLDEFRDWFDQFEQTLDKRIAADFSAGNLDRAINQALNDERDHRVQPL